MPCESTADCPDVCDYYCSSNDVYVFSSRICAPDECSRWEFDRCNREAYPDVCGEFIPINSGRSCDGACILIGWGPICISGSCMCYL